MQSVVTGSHAALPVVDRCSTITTGTVPHASTGRWKVKSLLILTVHSVISLFQCKSVNLQPYIPNDYWYINIQYASLYATSF